MKRDPADDSISGTPPAKRFRGSPDSESKTTVVKHHKLHHKQQNIEGLLDNPQDAALVSAQLSRALCIALYAAGFTSVQGRALNSFQALVEECMKLSLIHI